MRKLVLTAAAAAASFALAGRRDGAEQPAPEAPAEGNRRNGRAGDHHRGRPAPTEEETTESGDAPN